MKKPCLGVTAQEGVAQGGSLIEINNPCLQSNKYQPRKQGS